MSVVYYISNPGYIPYFLVSARTLRVHWDGDIQVHCWPKSIELVKKLASHPDISAQVHEIEEPKQAGGKNAQYLQKITLMRSLKGSHVFLDADTLVNGSLEHLFMFLDRYGFVTTQFNDWYSNKRLIRKRLKTLEPFIGKHKVYLDRVMNESYPSVNVGVLGFCSESPVLPVWEELARRAESVFIPDEVAMHPLVPEFQEAGLMHCMTSGAYNCSPKYQPKSLPDDEVKVWHGHGNMFGRQKVPRAHYMWRKHFEACSHIGGVDGWHESCGNRDLNATIKAFK